MTQERFDQILNSIQEEFMEQGGVNFATRKELCEVIEAQKRLIDGLQQKASMNKGQTLIQALDDYFS